MVDYNTFQREWDRLAGKEEAHKFAQWKHFSDMLKWLQVHRVHSGRTEKEIANALGWTEEKVITFEMSESKDIHLSDLLEYLAAINFKMDIRFSRTDETIKDEIEFYASKIQSEFKKLVEMAVDLEFIYKYNEAAFRMGATLITMFPNKQVVIGTLEKLFPELPMLPGSPFFVSPPKNTEENGIDFTESKVLSG